MALKARDSRRASSYCSTTVLVVFVALCLVGVWMLTSSSMVPAEMSPPTRKAKVKDKIAKSNSGPFEDASGYVTEESRVGDGNNGENDERTTENFEEKTEDDISAKEDDSTTSESENKPETQTYSDTNEKKEDTNEANETETDEQPQQKAEKKSKHNEVIQVPREQNEGSASEEKHDDSKDQSGNEVFPSAANSEIIKEASGQNGAWSTQAVESKNEKEVQASSLSKGLTGYKWKLCNVTTGPDYIPCLDNVEAIRKLHSTKHYEHRERHCPEEPPTCLVPLPEGYKIPIRWPKSREKIWYNNVPHTKLATVKGHQNWVKVTGEYLTFPGGGTQFKHGALHYIDFIQESLPDVAWGKRTRVILDVGCGVASFGGYLFDRDVIAMSFAPKDEHEAQVQFALERGIPAISAVMGTKRLPFPSKVFDVVHCARCRVPWHLEGGKLLLELNRLLRPGGYFIWSATPIYQDLPDDVAIWKAMSSLTKSMCWEMVTKQYDKVNQVGLAIFKKPFDNKCYEKRAKNNPPVCQSSDNPDAAWYIPLQACMHRLPVVSSSRGAKWPEKWPKRLEKTPYWLNGSQIGVYGKPAPDDFQADYEQWKRAVSKSYSNMGINWSDVRNVMDMRSVYGGFAAALRDMNVWVMNVVSIDSLDTLPIIFERGLSGIYHDWCESFSTYPRTYDLLHADHLFSKIKKRCSLLPLIAEVDRILRPQGKLIVRDTVAIIHEVQNMAKSLHWEIRMTYSKDNEGLLCVQKTTWRPAELANSASE